MKKNCREWLLFLLALTVILTVCGTLLFLILVNLSGLLRNDAGRDNDFVGLHTRTETLLPSRSAKTRCSKRIFPAVRFAQHERQDRGNRICGSLRG